MSETLITSIHRFIKSVVLVFLELPVGLKLYVFQNLITNMTNNVQNQDISRLLLHLPRAIDSRSSAEIIHYGQVAGTVHTQFRGVCETVENELNEVTLHLHEQGDANVAAIGDNIPE